MIIAECFGPTIQGEGPSAGQRASFIRLGRCNLSCIWCDTAYTWDPFRYNLDTELARTTPERLATWVQEQQPSLLVITGGEPLLQRSQVIDFLERINPKIDVEIETNGTQPPFAAAHRVRFIVSPKLENARLLIPYDTRHICRYLEHPIDAAFKFVVETLADLDELAQFANTHRIPPGRIWVMPQAQTRDELHRRLTPELAAATINHGWNLSGRMHIDLWDGERAR